MSKSSIKPNKFWKHKKPSQETIDDYKEKTGLIATDTYLSTKAFDEMIDCIYGITKKNKK